jgi:aminoglycoside/choline kinase family phosphotransferase
VNELIQAPERIALVEQVTPAWLTDALRYAGALEHAAVNEATGSRVGMGQMANTVRFQLTYDRAERSAPDTVVVKIPSTDARSRQVAARMDSYLKEVNFYQHVAPTVRVTVPRCFFADIDDSGTEFVLLLDDLTPGESCDQMSGCTVQQAALAIDQLAALHASGWRRPDLERNAVLRRGIDVGIAAARMMPDTLMGMFRDRYAALLKPAYMTVAERFAAGIDKFVDALQQPLTVMHGDFRLDNLIFAGRAGAVPLTVLDWQVVSLGPGMLDTAYFLGASLTPDVRRTHEDQLVRRYHRALCTGGVNDYSWEQCWQDYRLFSFAGLLMAIAASVQVERTERGDQMFMAMASRHAQQIIDNNALELVSNRC